MPEKKSVPDPRKTPTEAVTLSDVWEKVKPRYIQFVDWIKNEQDGFAFCIVEFIENTPQEYKNKWSRDQLKIGVKQDGIERILSGGNRLFAQLKDFILKENKQLSEMGKIQIARIGSGFEIDYRVTKA